MSSELHEVGCRSCGKGGHIWMFRTDGQGHLKAKCGYCGHETDFTLVTKPDPKGISVRFFY